MSDSRPHRPGQSRPDQSRRNLSLMAIFAWPAILALASLTGLIGALLADGLWDAIGSALLALSVIAIAVARITAPARAGRRSGHSAP